MPRLSLATRRALLAVMLVLPTALAACSGDSRVNSYRLNPSPAEDTLARRKLDTDNRDAITVDTNFRQLNEDWNRIWLMDRPTRLSRTPSPY